MFASSSNNNNSFNSNNDFDHPSQSQNRDQLYSSPTRQNFVDRRPSPDQHEPNSSDPLRSQFRDYDNNGSNGSGTFMDNDNEMRKYQGLGASNNNNGSYQGLLTGNNGDRSEPGSPVMGEPYERSHESGSSGTKVEEGRNNDRPQTMSSEGSYEQRGNGNYVSISSLFDANDE